MPAAVISELVNTSTRELCEKFVRSFETWVRQITGKWRELGSLPGASRVSLLRDAWEQDPRAVALSCFNK